MYIFDITPRPWHHDVWHHDTRYKNAAGVCVKIFWEGDGSREHAGVRTEGDGSREHAGVCDTRKLRRARVFRRPTPHDDVSIAMK
jgi:hypothetical protein